MMCVFYYVVLLFFAFIHSRTHAQESTQNTQKGISSDGEKERN